MNDLFINQKARKCFFLSWRTMNRSRFIYHYLKGRKFLFFLMFISGIFAVILSLLTPLIFRFFVDQLIGNQPLSNTMGLLLANLPFTIDDLRAHLWMTGLFMLFVSILQALFLFLRGYLSGLIAEKMVFDIRNDLYRHLQKLPYEYYIKAKTGELVQRCTSDVEQIRKVFSNQLQQLFRCLATIFIACAILFSLNVKLSLYALSIMPFLVVFAIVLTYYNQKAFLRSDEAEGVLTDVTQESLSGIRVIKAFGQEQYELNRFNKINDNYRRITLRLTNLAALYWSVSDFMCMIQMLIVVIVGIQMSIQHEITIGTFFVFISYITLILWPVRQLGRILADVAKITVSIDRLNEILNEPTEDLETGLQPELQGDIVFDHVEFQYADASQPVLNDISFHIKKGETVAIIGPTGSGKSSLVHLLSRLYDYTNGHIYIDGVELKSIKKDYLRKNIGIVLQEPFLFSKSIFENIRLNNLQSQVKDIENAAKIASIHRVITEFSQGYQTLIGEKGVTLSGGQKQRIAIARTILNHNKILIFDDSLSAVDTQTDANIRQALQNLNEKVTTIIITQRINSAKDADYIYVLENGRITQVGKHEDLIKQTGLYQEIYKIQSAYITGGSSDTD